MAIWDVKIYGGDSSLEWREKFYASVECEEFDSTGRKELPLPEDVFKENESSFFDMVDNSDLSSNEKNIGILVIGAMSLNSGVALSYSYRETVVDSTKVDEWSQTSLKRKYIMDNMRKVIKDHKNGEVYDVQSEDMSGKILEEETEEYEFNKISGLIKRRISKLEKEIEEKEGSVSEEYYKGFKEAHSENIEFMKEFLGVMDHCEQLGTLLEEISKGIVEEKEGNKFLEEDDMTDSYKESTINTTSDEGSSKQSSSSTNIDTSIGEQ